MKSLKSAINDKRDNIMNEREIGHKKIKNIAYTVLINNVITRQTYHWFVEKEEIL